MDIFSIFTLLGGLGLFLFGMNVMSDAIGRQAGGKFKAVLESLTSSRIKGVLLGAGVTAVIQSSGATIVMVLGFINSGIMTLENSVGVIMGANIGTTATAWVLSLNSINGTSVFLKLLTPDSFVPILAFVGMILLVFTNNERKKDIGRILLGFAVLMYGMSAMSDSMKPLAEYEDFRNILLLFKNPILGVLMGFVMTAIIQSSSASVGILQAMSVTGGITFGNALPIIMGQNIGACLVVLISSAGSNRDAKRAAWIHLYFNIIGTVLFLCLFYGANAIFHFAWTDMAVNSVEIAIIHSVFKLASTVVLLPFTKQLIKLAKLTVRSGPEEEKIQLLDDRFLNTPSVAVARCRELTATMADMSKETFSRAFSLVGNYSESEAKIVQEQEKEIDLYEDKLGTYMVKLSSKSVNMADSHEISKLLHCIGDFERISDHAVNILSSAEELSQKSIMLSDTAFNDLKIMYAAVMEALELAINSFEKNDAELASRVEPLEQVVDLLKGQLKSRHIARLQRGECTTMLGFVFSDLITNLERVADHCSNIAVCVIQVNRDTFDTHSYLNTLKSTNNERFEQLYGEYINKYMLE